MPLWEKGKLKRKLESQRNLSSNETTGISSRYVNLVESARCQDLNINCGREVVSVAPDRQERQSDTRKPDRKMI